MASGGVVVVLVAHGSRAEAANAAHRSLARAVGEALAAGGERGGAPGTDPDRTHVVPAFLELAEPSIPGAIDDAVAAGAKRVVVLPHFLHPGRHVREHIPELISAAGSRHLGVEVRLLDASGSSPEMVGLLAGLVRAAVGC